MFFSQFIKFLRYFGKGYQVKLIYMLFLSFMINLLEFLSIVLVFPFIMIMVNPGRVVNNPIAKFVEENFNIHGVNNMIIFIGSLIAGTIIIKNLYSILIQYWQSKMISKWGLEVKEKMLEYFLYAPYEADLQRGDNNIINKITSNVDDVMQYFVSKVISFISNSFVILFVFIVLMFMLPLYTLLAVLFFAIAGSIQSGFFKQWGVKLTIKKLNLTNGPYSSIINTLSCIKDIKINGCQKYFYDMYDDISEKIIPFNEKINLIPVIPQYIIEIIFIFTMTILCLGILVQYGENPSNILVSFGVVAIAIYRVVPQVYKNQVYLNYINLTKIKADELFKLYEQYSLYEYSKNKDTKEKISFKENIQIQQMSYSYDKKENVLNNVSLNIRKGEFIGIVGLSGAGKSTLIDCILGLLDYKGTIYVDDERLNTDNIQKFRNIIGYVPQKICTVEGDIYTNVAWGIERKDIDKEKVDEVLKTAQLYDQLKQTENGLEIELKQDGTGLSGGQMQRIGIARALYRDPEIIILDEATANLDVKIENKLTDILASLKGEKTIIAIAHRLSTLVNSDRIAYIKDGTIVDVGTFKELSSKYPDFNEIVKLSRIKLDDDN
ncbi:TPA: ABC transporter ATP-binding protein [Candidatus Avigastranaerophilus faecigallinarum]|nr:ABC transporter ATP-binding protein [Candidatus Avigastranaerophilus faecigallinarum]